LTYKDFMILCPSSNFVNKVATCLKDDFGIPTEQKEKVNISNEHWRLLLILRMLHSHDDLALRQWLNIVGIDDKEIEHMRREAMKQKEGLFDYCSRVDKAEIKQIFVELNELENCTNDLEKFRSKLLSFPQLIIEESLFSEVGITINEVTQQPNSIGSVIKFIHEKFGLIDSEVEISEDISGEDRTLVTTLYSAKGLEAEFVLIMWLNDRFFPSPNRDKKEELRVLYVGITRAKQDVILTFNERFDKKKRIRIKGISPFLYKIINYLDIIRLMKSDFQAILSSIYSTAN